MADEPGLGSPMDSTRPGERPLSCAWPSPPPIARDRGGFLSFFLSSLFRAHGCADSYPAPSFLPGSAQVGSRHNSGAFIASGSPGMVVRTREHSLSKQQILALLPNQSAPVITIPGVAGVVRAEMLQDKRTALTQDTDGNIALWDLALSSVVRSFGQADFEEKKKELHKVRDGLEWYWLVRWLLPWRMSLVEVVCLAGVGVLKYRA